MVRDAQKIVEEQVLRWKTLRSEFESLPSPDKSRARPCVTISTQMGSQGLGVAERVADQLKFELYERELVELIAQTAHVRRDLVESVDEHTQGAIETWMARQLGFMAESDYVTNLSRVLLTLAHHGRAVVVGRGAQFILDPARTLRVRIVAPFELRIARISARDHLSAKEARAKVLAADADRVAFVRKHFDREVDDARNYDLVINTEHLNLDTCAGITKAAFNSRFG